MSILSQDHHENQHNVKKEWDINLLVNHKYETLLCHHYAAGIAKKLQEGNLILYSEN